MASNRIIHDVFYVHLTTQSHITSKMIIHIDVFDDDRRDLSPYSLRSFLFPIPQFNENTRTRKREKKKNFVVPLCFFVNRIIKSNENHADHTLNLRFS